MTEWIKFSDRKPEKDQWIIVYSTYGDLYVRQCTMLPWETINIDYWLPLPPLPYGDEYGPGQVKWGL